MKPQPQQKGEEEENKNKSNNYSYSLKVFLFCFCFYRAAAPNQDQTVADVKPLFQTVSAKRQLALFAATRLKLIYTV